MALAGAVAVLAGCASAPGTSAADRYQFGTDYPACMSDLGWDSSTDADGGVITSIPSGQRSAYEAARDQCLELIGANDRPAPSADQLAALYEAQLVTRECLTAQGYSLPEPPSQQVFLESSGAWSPYTSLPSEALSEKFEELTAACPQPTAESLGR